MGIQTLVVDLNDYVDECLNNALDAEAIVERIDELKSLREDYEADGADMGREETEELRRLVAFHGDVKREFGRFEDGLTMVAQDRFEQFSRYEAEAEHGLGADVELSDFVDWTGYAKARQVLFAEFELCGQKVLVRDDS